MRNTQWGWGIHHYFICIFSVMMAHRCVGGGNLTRSSCSEQDRLALVKFKHSVKDAHGLLSSWGVGNDCCKWERVDCDATGRVVSLHLRRYVREDYELVDRYINFLVEDYQQVYVDEDYYLVGDEVDSCLTELENLQHLDLSGNDFQKSRIPKFIGSLKQLRYLNLSYAGFSGNIPHQLGNLSNLKVLDLSSNSISRELMTNDMAWISGLSKLEHLDLSGVDLSRTQNLNNLLYTIPSLSKLILSSCGLYMPRLVSHHLNSSRELASIKYLDSTGNDFRGELPSFIVNMTSLMFLDLSGNNLSMVSFENLLYMMPSSVSKLCLAGSLNENINFSPINLNFSTHSNIQHLDLSWNGIEGRFPSVLTNMSSLLSLDLSGNKFNSSIPVMPNLLKLDISANRLGHIEDC
ncbi:putative leucine-rich repeat-containing, plant-type, leucine-rich repeat domain superfamily [Helianthus debilis subsp. tardiflorus]